MRTNYLFWLILAYLSRKSLINSLNSKMAPKKRSKESSGDVPIISDARFSDMHSAPIFKRMKAEKHKVTLDPRFAKVLNSDTFKVSEGKYDKYGRKQKKTEAKDELSSFYTLGDDGDDQEDFDVNNDDDDDSLADAEEDLETNKDRSSSNKKLKPKPKQIKRQKFKPGEKLPTDEVEKRLAHLNRMARGELESGDDVGDSSDSDSDSEEDSGDNSDDAMLSRNEDIPVDVMPEGGETTRLAVCNLDWDHLGAVDILKLVESFVPAGGSIIKVSVYPSDYGLERIEQEEKFGPSIATHGGESEDEESEDESEDDGELGELEGGDGGDRKRVGIVFAGSDDEGSDLSDAEGLPAPMFGAKRKGSVTVAKGYGKTLDYDEEELRAYEIQRSKYYFGVVECADVQTASALYDKVNGMEWEYSSTKVDLSFIPEELDFSVRQCREGAVKVPEGYEAPEFVSSARQQSKVTCTWDEDDPTRTRELNRLSDWKGVGDAEDVSHLIAVDDDSGSDDSGGGKRDKGEMRRLMGLDGSDSEGGEVNSDYFEEGGEGEESEEEYNFVDPAKELALKEVLEGRGKKDKEETPWEKTQRKLTEKKKEKREARKAKLSGVAYVKQDKSVEDVSDQDFFITSDDEAKTAKKTGKKAEKEEVEVDDEEEEDDGRNYDMRAVVRAEKMKGKKLKGVRAKKEAKRLAQSGATEFEADVADPRFTAMLDGDSRYGLDPTSSSFKKTEGMTAILDEQRRRRTKKSQQAVKASVSSEASGEGDMSSLVSSLKNRALHDKPKKGKKNRD